MRRPRLALAALAVVPLVLAGCSTDSTADAGAGTPSARSAAGTSAPSFSTTPASAGGASPVAAGCRGSAAGVPAGSNSAPTLDVDGDGRPDTEWIAQHPGADGGVAFGVTTTSEGTFGATIASASPVARSVLVADVTGTGELIALASDGRQVLLYAISSCSLLPVQNAQGQQYAFDLGFTGFGTGVGCIDVDGDGTRDLAGLRADGTSITRTIVELTGPTAANGAGDTISGASADQVELAHQVTCGDLTLAANGVRSAP
ncbi:MAG: uncharacterized protein JWR70_238 [Modestobacter sp.]|nr:uncharacterized protein [Modestobacter sp.]